MTATVVKTRTLGLGLVGAGSFGNFTGEVFDVVQGLRLRGVADVNPQAAKAIAKRYSVPCHNQYHKLLASQEIDVVMINTPNDLHEQMTLEALAAGKHVFCAKPLALTSEGIKKIYHVARRRNLLVGVDFALRYSTCNQLVRQFLPQLGELRSMMVNHQATEATIKTPWYWDKNRSGGWFVTTSIHFYDLFNFLAGTKTVHSLSAHEYLDRLNGRTKAIASHVAYPDSQLVIYHNFTANYQTAKTLVLLDFDHAHIEISGWVPTEMVITTPSKLVIPNAILKEPDDQYRYRLTLAGDRNNEYHKMVARGLKHFQTAVVTGTPQIAYQDPSEIEHSHLLAFAATAHANLIDLP